MKNAYVLLHHRGDNGTVDEGMILENITDKRFTALEKKGLVREATEAEVKKGYKPPFIPTRVTIAGETADGGQKLAKEPENKKALEPANKAAK